MKRYCCNAKVVFLILCFTTYYNSFAQIERVSFVNDSIQTIGIRAFNEYMQGRFGGPPKLEGLNLMSSNLNITQTENKSKTFFISQGSYQDSIRMDGALDGINTYTRLSKYNRLENEYSQFIPMESIVIANKGKNSINAPRLLINNERNWFNTDNFLSESIGEKGIFLDKNTILHLWNFLKNNREHYSPSGYDGMNSYKMFAVYGYSTCDITAYVCRLLASRNGNNVYSYLMPHHTVAEVSDGLKSSVVDSDLEVFYLNLDNQTLAGIEDVNSDKYLINRTKHFGKNLVYNKEVDAWISVIYNPWGRFAPEKTGQILQYPSSSFDFILRPDESIFMKYDKAEMYYHNWGGDNRMPESFSEYLISNSKHILSTNFDTLTFNAIFEDFNNINLLPDSLHHPVVSALGEDSYFIYRVNLPFPILDARLEGKFCNNTNNDSIQIFLSLDNDNTWEKIWTSTNIGFYRDSIDIGFYFPRPLPNQTTIPPYGYSLKFVFNPTDSLSACGLDSLYIENTFQISKRFLPTLKLGENSIFYQDSNNNDTTRNIQVTINWKESSENNPPNKIISPVFPLQNSSVDSLYFGFEWEPAIDVDGDTIEDYEFFLADHPEMNYPLSPNFNQYISAFDDVHIRPYFKVKETGWLNDGETYYWRVRARDARGAWGEWSDTWSFTPHGVMRPINGKAEIVEQSIKLSWERNSTGKQPDYYKIYASDEMNGFSPDNSTFFAVSDSTEFFIPFDKEIAPFSFFRISACDTLGQESLISDVIAIPYPYMYSTYDSIRQDSIFTMNLFSNERFYPYYYYGYLEDRYIPTITVEQKPDWLNYDQSGILYSIDTELARKLVYQDSLQRSVTFSLDDGWGNVATQTIVVETVAVNNKPALMLSDSTVCEGSLFSAYITSTDGDVKYGDTHMYIILQKPDWLNYEIKGDTVQLFGIPKGDPATGFTHQDSLLRILAVDTKNDSTSIDFLIQITPHVRILSALKDTAIEDQPYSYSLVVDSYEKDIFISLLNVPGWLQMNEPNYFSGTTDIYNLNDTILRFVTYDRVCNVYAEHDVIIAIQHINHSPVITTTELPEVQNGVPYTAKIEAYDIDSMIEDVDLYYNMIPLSSWLTINHRTGELSGAPFLSHFDNLTFEFIVSDKQGASDSKVITIPNKTTVAPDIDAGKMLCQIIKSSQTEYYAKVESAREAGFRYSLYSVDGTLLFSSHNWNITEGTYYLPIDMSKYLNGVYIFVGYENNKALHSIKFIKW